MTAAPVRARRYLGRQISISERASVYLCADALEIDTLEGFDVETRRVFFSDVQLVMRHRRFSRWGLWLSGLSALSGLFIWLIALSSHDPDLVARIVFWVAFFPNLPVLAIFLIPYAQVTVFGKRTKAVMSWHYRHGRAGAVFAELSALIGQAQAAERAALAAGAAAATPTYPVPLPPSGGPGPLAAPGHEDPPAPAPRLGDGL